MRLNWRRSSAVLPAPLFLPAFDGDQLGTPWPEAGIWASPTRTGIEKLSPDWRGGRADVDAGPGCAQVLSSRRSGPTGTLVPRAMMDPGVCRNSRQGLTGGL